MFNVRTLCISWLVIAGAVPLWAQDKAADAQRNCSSKCLSYAISTRIARSRHRLRWTHGEREPRR